MPTAVGYLFVAAAVILIRQVIVGRVNEIPSDVKDLTLSLLKGDTAGASSVLAQRGSNADMSGTVGAGVGDLLGTNGVDPNSLLGQHMYPGMSATASSFIQVCKQLGGAAKGYQKGATGPDYYDCSGLIYTALKQMGIYTGFRFWTGNFDIVAPKFATKVTGSYYPGDIILWPGHHMGVVDGTNSMYSARSVAKGIGSGPIDADIAYFGSQPEYWRLNGASASSKSTPLPTDTAVA